MDPTPIHPEAPLEHPDDDESTRARLSRLSADDVGEVIAGDHAALGRNRTLSREPDYRLKSGRRS
jgi:hypothetical protein